MLLSGDTRREPVSLLTWVVGRNCVLPSGCRTEILFSGWLIAEGPSQVLEAVTFLGVWTSSSVFRVDSSRWSPGIPSFCPSREEFTAFKDSCD